jgi:hypothetical protein
MDWGGSKGGGVEWSEVEEKEGIRVSLCPHNGTWNRTESSLLLDEIMTVQTCEQ